MREGGAQATPVTPPVDAVEAAENPTAKPSTKGTSTATATSTATPTPKPSAHSFGNEVSFRHRREELRQQQRVIAAQFGGRRA